MVTDYVLRLQTLAWHMLGFDSPWRQGYPVAFDPSGVWA